MNEPFKYHKPTTKKPKWLLKLTGSKGPCFIAGPCSIESEKQIHIIAESVASQGAQILRGGAFKPRTSPYKFQGIGIKGLNYLQQAAQAHNLLSITEVMNEKQADLAADKIDILQVGTRNMYNYSLLKMLGEINKPILLKRAFSATYQEFLYAAEYILDAGNPAVILCERGIRTFESHTRNTLDLNAVPVLQQSTHLPIFVDPSHGTGLRNLVIPMSKAAIAAGANGLLVEVHHDPNNSISDAQQTISTQQFSSLVKQCKRIAALELIEEDDAIKLF